MLVETPSDPYARYQAALGNYCQVCHGAPDRWHRPDVAEFTELRRLLLPRAEAGDMHCQYAVATILKLGLQCESEAEFADAQAANLEEASRLWLTAARQGHWPALDNLVTSGVGPEADAARRAFQQLAEERPELVGASHGMPVFGPPFMQQLLRQLYGEGGG